jgi:hypothetical protein
VDSSGLWLFILSATACFQLLSRYGHKHAHCRHVCIICLRTNTSAQIPWLMYGMAVYDDTALTRISSLLAACLTSSASSSPAGRDAVWFGGNIGRPFKCHVTAPIHSNPLNSLPYFHITYFLALDFLPCRWRHYVIPKRSQSPTGQ